MKLSKVYIEDLAFHLPPNVVSTLALEHSLKPCYQKLGLQIGQLETLTGLKERRFFDPGTRPSEQASNACLKILERHAGLKDKIGALINSSVCRDYLEPATASVITRNLGLSEKTVLFDVSNACLGFATAMSVAANMIELGQVEAVLVVSCEISTEVVEHTISNLLAHPSEKLFLESIPTLTLGSAAVAMLLTNQKLNSTGLRFMGGTSFNDSRQSELCRWGPDTGFPSPIPHSMVTDGKTLLEKGAQLALKTWQAFLQEQELSLQDIDVTFCHQVGTLHRNVVFEALGLNVAKDFSTFETCGNTGSAALPLTLAKGLENKAFQPGQRAVLLGIGSGLVCTMYCLDWRKH